MVILPPTGVYNTHIYPCLLWNIWKSCNKLLFDNLYFSPENIVLKNIQKAKEWEAAQTKLHKPSPPRRNVLGVPTSLNETFFYFFDAAWCSVSGSCGMGWNFHEPKGNQKFQHSSSRSFVGSVFVKEALALRSVLA